MQTSESYERLDNTWRQILSRVANNPALVNTDSDLKLNKPQLKVDVDRDKVAAVGASVVEIGHTLETMLGGRQVTRFKRDGKQYDVMRAGGRRQPPRSPSDLTNIYVRGGNGEHDAALEPRHGDARRSRREELNHFNKLRAAIDHRRPARLYARAGARLTSRRPRDKVLPARRQIDYDRHNRASSGNRRQRSG